MVAVPIQSHEVPAPSTSACVTINTGSTETTSISAGVLSIGWRGMLISCHEEVEEGAHAWVSVTLPNGTTINPLVRLTRRDMGPWSARYIHLFPRDRAAIELYHAAKTVLY